MKHKKIEFKDLTLPLKIGVVGGILIVVTWTLLILIGMVGMVV